MADRNAKIAEVVEADTTAFTAQCYRLGEPPPLGSIVVTGDSEGEVFAVVCNAATVSIDASRRVAALGHDQESEEAVRQEHPELERLLRTDFRAQVIGHRPARGPVSHRLPPRPASIHAFARLAADEQVRDLTQSLDFLAHLVTGAAATRDEAAAACLRLASRTHQDPSAFLVRAGKGLAALLSQDTPRLYLLLRMLKG